MRFRSTGLFLVCCLCYPIAGSTAPKAVSLHEAILLAQQADPFTSASLAREKALLAEGQARGSLPDTRLSLGFANVAADSLSFRQEPMTQLQFKVSQQFPRGRTRELTRRSFDSRSREQPVVRDARAAEVTLEITKLWLTSFEASRTTQLISDDRALFEHLVELTGAKYRSALGNVRQQDFIRAKLELSLLEDRLIQLGQRGDAATAALNSWLFDDSGQHTEYRVPEARLAEVSLHPALGNLEQLTPTRLLALLSTHPVIRRMDQRIETGQLGVSLARENHKPNWGMSAGYGYRGASPQGSSRADLLSVGLTFDMPVFSSSRQQGERNAANEKLAIARYDRDLALRTLLREFDAQRARLLRLQQRQTLYQRQLLDEHAEQAAASLTAYTNDAGDFAELVRARIAELNARIDSFQISIDILKTIAHLNYLVTGNSAPGEGEAT